MAHTVGGNVMRSASQVYIYLYLNGVTTENKLAVAVPSTFSTLVTAGTSYNVTVTQGNVTNGMGTMPNNNVTNVVVSI